MSQVPDMAWTLYCQSYITDSSVTLLLRLEDTGTFRTRGTPEEELQAAWIYDNEVEFVLQYAPFEISAGTQYPMHPSGDVTINEAYTLSKVIPSGGRNPDKVDGQGRMAGLYGQFVLQYVPQGTEEGPPGTAHSAGPGVVYQEPIPRLIDFRLARWNNYHAYEGSTILKMYSTLFAPLVSWLSVLSDGEVDAFMDIKYPLGWTAYKRINYRDAASGSIFSYHVLQDDAPYYHVPSFDDAVACQTTIDAAFGWGNRFLMHETLSGVSLTNWVKQYGDGSYWYYGADMPLWVYDDGIQVWPAKDIQCPGMMPFQGAFLLTLLGLGTLSGGVQAAARRRRHGSK